MRFNDNLGKRVKLLLFCSLFVVSGFLIANDRDKGVKQCLALQDDQARLLCYDTLFGTPEITGKQNANSVITQPVEQEKSTEKEMAKALEDDFGSEQIKKEPVKEEIAEITAQVVSISENRFGVRTFELSNAQKWRELEKTRLRVKEGQEVIIKKGIISNYFLKATTGNRSSRVKRIK